MTAPSSRTQGAGGQGPGNPQAFATLDRGLAPARARIDRARTQHAFFGGLDGGIRLLPATAVLLVVAYLASTSLGGQRIHPLFVPAALAVLPLVAAAAAWLGSLPRRSSAYDAALALDREGGSGDRLSAAVEFTEGAAAAAHSPRFVDAAVEDGLERLARVQAETVPLPDLPRRIRARRLVAAFLIALIPMFISAPSAPDGSAHDVARTERDLPPGTAAAREREAKKADAPRGADRGRDAKAAPEAAREEGVADRNAAAPQKSPASGKAGSGAGGNLGGDQRSTAGQGTPKESKGGTPSGGSQGGGGQGESSSSANAGEKKPTKPQTPKAAKQRPAVETASAEGREEESSASPGGPSRGGGKTSPVGNKRSALERGTDREEEPEIEDEDIQQDEEESEQRGGVMPMTRDRNTSPTRELTISGDGPPRDGRGGPTPPKKSRGTASLVLGITLPDQIRGQLNPGTAKTNLEQVQPQSDKDPGATAAAATGHRRGTPQSLGIPGDDLDPVVLRYHGLLKRPSAGPPATDRPQH